MEEGIWSKTELGTPQGAVVSPLLANVYLHYVLDLWVQQWRGRHARGDVIIVRYADDFVMGFQYREEAERFLRELTERMGKFGLSLHPEKSRLIEFGRFAAANRKQRGQGKPETFDFLGFTHICTTTRKGKSFTIKRKTVAKRLCRKLKEVKKTLMRRRHEPIPEVGKANSLGERAAPSAMLLGTETAALRICPVRPYVLFHFKPSSHALPLPHFRNTPAVRKWTCKAPCSPLLR
jgi:hypothetical protein